MSYGFVAGRFVAKSVTDCISDNIQLWKNLMPDSLLISTSPEYQFLKMVSYREARLWGLLEDYIYNIHIFGSSGETLIRHGIDNGILKLEGEKATGVVQFTCIPPATIPIDSELQSASGNLYYTTETFEVKQVIEFTRSLIEEDNTDNFPSDYETTANTDIDWIADNEDGTGKYDTSEYILDYDESQIDWTPLGDQPISGATYYVKISGEIKVSVGIEAYAAGSNYNTSENTITTLVNSIPNVQSVTNLYTIFSGRDDESDESYRRRLLQAPHAYWTLSKIKSSIDELPYIRSSKIKWESFVDQYSIFSLSDGFEHELDYSICQIFKPGTDIASISEVSLYVKASGDPGPLTVELRDIPINYDGTLDYEEAIINSDYLIDSCTKSREEIDRDETGEYIETDFTLECNRLDNTRQYMIRIRRSPSINVGTSYNILYIDEENYLSGGLYYEDLDTLVEDEDLYFKTWSHYAGFTSIISSTENWTDTKSNVEDVIDNTGKAAGISRVVEQARVMYIYVTGKLVLLDGYTLTGVSANIHSELLSYLNSLEIEDDVLWSEIHYIIMTVEGVKDVKNVRLKHKKITDSDWIQNDVYENVIIDDREIASLIGVNFEIYGA
jgi:hypothetical protein